MIDSPFPFPDHARPRPDGGETHRIVAVGGGVAVAFQFEQRDGNAGFQTAVFGLDPPTTHTSLPVVIGAAPIPFGQGWELRTSGLWADQNREVAFEHWSYGLEAFALAIDEPDELLRRAIGHRVPLGWELDFSAASPPEPIGDPADRSFRQAGTVDGLILTADGEQPFSGVAERSRWGADPAGRTRLDALGETVESEPASVVLPTLWGPWVVGSETA